MQRAILDPTDWISLLRHLTSTGLEIVSADRESGVITLKVPRL